MKITRHFCGGRGRHYDGIDFAARDSAVRRPNGSAVFEMKGLVAPAHWSQTAVDMLAQKYFRRAGVPSAAEAVPETGVPEWLWPSVPAPGATFGGETDARQVFHRLAGCWAYWGWRGGYFSSEDDARAFYDETCHMLALQMAAPNSPQWFNCFSGRERIVTKEYGSCPLSDLAGEDVTVWTRAGWRSATVSMFGRQVIRRVTLAPAFRSSVTYRPGWNVGKTSIRVTVEVTADHRWPLADGGETTNLSVGDVVPASAVAADKESSDFRAGFQHGVIFGDGNVAYRSKVGGVDRYRARLCGGKAALAWAFDQVTTPPCFDGDPLVHVRSAHNLKEFPAGDSSTDYLAGFVEGWAAADGNEKNGDTMRVSTNRPDAREWLEKNAALAGWVLTGHSWEPPGEHHFGDKVYVSTQPQHSLVISRGRRAWRVVAVEENVADEPVFCAVVPGEHEFTLESGIVTGNCGLHWAYGIEGPPQGHWYVDPPTGELRQAANAYERISAHACFLLSAKDDLVNPGGIMDLWTREARVFKHGGGCGSNLSELRGEGEPLSGGGQSSGTLSFLAAGDRSAGAIKSGGTTRRAAKLVCLDMDHPDVEKFIDLKAVEEEKVAALVAGSHLLARHEAALAAAWAEAAAGAKPGDDPARAPAVARARARALAEGVPPGYLDRLADSLRRGERHGPARYDTEWEGEGYRTVNGQNANNSVRVPNAFLDAMDAGADWPLYWRTEKRRAAAQGRRPVPARSVPAADLWGRVVRAAHACADPGVQFHDTINEWNPIPECGTVNTSNPCQPGFATLLTPSGVRVMDDIDVGSTVWSGREWTQVVRKVRTGVKPVYRYATTAGCFIGTDNHRVFSRGQRVEAGAATEIDTCQAPAAMSFREPDDQATVDGWVVGDGMVHKASNNLVVLCLGRGDGVFHEQLAGFVVRHRPGIQDTAWEVRTTITAADLPRVYDRVVPDRYRFADRNTACNFLRGLYAANGSVCDGRVTLKATSLTLVRQVQEMLSGLGIASYYTTCETAEVTWANGKTYTRRTSYDLNISTDRNQFRRCIGFLHEGKAKALAEACDTTAQGQARKTTYDVVAVEPLGEMPVYDITVAADGHSYWTGGLLVSNCGEYHSVDDSACNLASLNLLRFLAAGEFRVNGFRHAVRLWTLVLEITVSMAQLPSREVAVNTHRQRQLGLGYANLGGLLMTLGLPYDSPEGRAWAGAVTALMHFEAYRTSAEIAGELGPFADFAANREHMLRVVRNHRAAANPGAAYEGLTVKPVPLDARLVPHYLARAVWDAGDDMVALGEKNGFRNAQATCLAPTGCLVAGSLVLTDAGLRRIESLGDPDGARWQDVDFQVATDDGPRRATKFYVNGEDDVIRVTTRCGYQIAGTPKHRVKVVNAAGDWEWKRFGDLSAGDRVPLMLGGMGGDPVAVPLPECPPEYFVNAGRGVRTPASMTADLACLVGLFMANGSLHAKGVRLAVAKDDGDLVSWCLKAARSLFGIEAKCEDEGGYVTVHLNSTQLRSWWEAAGFAKRPGAKAGKGRVCHTPDAVLASNDALVYGAFLRGLFSGDGTTACGLPSLTNKSRDFVAEVQTMLLALGVGTRADWFVGGYSQRPVYRLTVRTADFISQWQEMVGFIPARKAALVRAGESSRNDYVYPPRHVIDAVCPVGHAERKVAVRHLRHRGGIKRSLAARLFRETGHAGLGKSLGYIFEEVESATLEARAPTYDLSVPGNVTYVANGFVSHNTIALVMDCDTTGVEPDFSLVKFKTLAGGGTLVLTNQALVPALLALGYTKEQAADVLRYVRGHRTLAGAPHRGRLEKAGAAVTDLAVLAGAFHVRFAMPLEKAGLSTAEVEELNDYVCGTMTVEGAPHLKPEHLAVFDCANRCGARGMRSISVNGHIEMLAAVAPFLSGSASKTINIPSESTLEDVSHAYRRAHALMVKACALYRNGSKLSQPLSNVAALAEAAAAAVLAEPRPARGRRKLPRRRQSYTQKARVGGHAIYLTAGRYPDGTLGEIFLTFHKEGAAFRSMANAFAIAVSLGLQYGVPLEEYIDAFVGMRFEPQGPVVGHQWIRFASSFVDYIFRELAIEFLGDMDMANLGAAESDATTVGVVEHAAVDRDTDDEGAGDTPAYQTNGDGGTATKAVAARKTAVARQKGFEGDPCSRCGQLTLIRTGPCLQCQSCGHSSGGCG